MAKITLMKPYRQTETLSLLELTDLVSLIRGDEYRTVVDELRKLYPVLDLQREADGSVTGAEKVLKIGRAHV